MKNLKKVLSLVLVFAMAFGLMISANAATFSDQNDIKNTDAVALLDSLNIMAGHADGSFEPTGVLTRAQVAKMVYVARTGGVDDQAVLYKNGNNAFTDTKGHWAEGYINYAAAKGFVAGRGNGKFDPDASITGYELMKIALCALGYDSEVEGFVGASWKSNTAALAQEAGLTDGYTADPTAPITRDNSARVFANLVYATTVRYRDGIAYTVSDIGVSNRTFGSAYLSLVEGKGIMLANDKVGIEGGAALGDGVIGIDVADTNGKFDGKVEKTFNVGKYDINVPEEFIGQNVSVLYRENSNGNITNIYGVNATTEFNKVITVSMANMGTLTDKNMAGAQVYDNYVEIATQTGSNAYYDQSTGMNYAVAKEATKGNNWALFTALRTVPTRLIDNDGDGVYEFAFQTTLNVAKVATAISGNISLTDLAGSLAIPTLTSTNATGIDGLAKDDIVVVKKYGSQYVVAKCDKFDATVNGYTNGAIPDTATLDGVVYQSGSMGVNGVPSGVLNGRLVGQKGTYYSYSGKLVYSTDITGIIPNYCLIEYAENSGIEGIRVKALLDTGVTGTYKVSMYDNKPAAINASLFTTTSGAIGDEDEEILAYTLNSDGTINLMPATPVEVNKATAYTKGTAQLFTGSNYYVSASTVAFVQDNTTKLYYVYKGLGTIPGIQSANMDYIGGNEISKPMYYTNAIYFDEATFKPSQSTDFYVVTSAISTIDQLGTCQFTAYLNNEAVTLKGSQAVGNILKTAKNSMFTFEFDSNGNVSNATMVAEQYKNGFAVSSNDTNSIILATVTAPAKGPDTTYDNNTTVNVFTVDNNTKYFYVDTVAGTVREGSYSDIVKYDMLTITKDVNDTFANWTMPAGTCTPMCQISVVEDNLGDNFIDYVFIYSAPIKSQYKAIS